MNALTPTGGNGGSTMIPQNLDQAMRLAEMMARAKLVPDHLRNASDMLMVVEQAMRWSMSPYAVAQCTSVIQGKLMFSGTLVSAAVHSSGILHGRLSYEFNGEGENRTIIVRGNIRGEAEPRDISVRLKDAKTTNQMWVKQSDQQLVYFATRAWARRHTPEVMLGVYSPEEFDEPRAAPDTFSGTTIEAAPEPAPASVPERPKRTMAMLVAEIRADLEAARTAADVDAVMATPQVQYALDNARNGARKELDIAVASAMDRTRTDDPLMDGEAEPEPVENEPALAKGEMPEWLRIPEIDGEKVNP